MPQTVLFFTKGEVAELVRTFLEQEGRDVFNAIIQFSSEGVHVGNCPEAAAPCSCDDEPEDFDDAEAPEDFVGHMQGADVLAAIRMKPRTAWEIAEEIRSDACSVNSTLGHLGDKVAKVAPAREDGETVSRWMATGSDEYGAFVAQEKERVEAQVEKWNADVLKHAPAFYERYEDRMTILENLISGYVATDEEIRRDCKSIFYAMAEKGLLEHHEHGWRAAKTDADRVRVAAIQGGIREVLRGKEEGLTTDEIRDALPEQLDKNLIRHCLRHMDDAYRGSDGRRRLKD